MKTREEIQAEIDAIWADIYPEGMEREERERTKADPAKLIAVRTLHWVLGQAFGAPRHERTKTLRERFVFEVEVLALRLWYRLNLILCWAFGHRYLGAKDATDNMIISGPPGTRFCPKCMQFEGRTDALKNLKLELRRAGAYLAMVAVAALVAWAVTR